MTTDEMRIAVAEHLGWDASEDVLTGSGMVQHPDGGRVPRNLIPNFPEDLNAMAEAEKVLFGTLIRGFNAAGIYWNVLTNVCKTKQVWHATAPQRAEAFLKTVGKWIEKAKQ